MAKELKASELRIGNLLQKDNGEVFTVLRLDNTKDILVKEQRGLLTLDYNLFGIPLTPERLEKFGFEKDHPSSITLYKDIGSDFSIAFEDEYGLYICGMGMEYSYFTGMDYVHQLQNLYFALTGEELQTK